MQELTPSQLKEILKTPVIEGTAEQIRLLTIRVNELCRMNGRDWVAAHSGQLLDQWERVLASTETEKRSQGTTGMSSKDKKDK